MPMVLLVIDSSALAKVEDAAAEQGPRYDTLLNQQFQEFLEAKEFKPATVKPVVQAPTAAPQSIDIREDLLKAMIGAARTHFADSTFVFNDLVPLVPELDALPQQERTKFASLFSRRYADFDSGILKLGKNSSKATEYGFK